MSYVGQLIYSPDYVFMVYADREDILRFLPHPGFEVINGYKNAQSMADMTASFWKRKIGKPVQYTNPKIPFLVLNQEGRELEILSGSIRGWIHNKNDIIETLIRN